ncbi:MAG: SAM-dependent chlorinase/fluorinase [Prevotellaceae bacterium]|jgi:S-adenosylmethionine hydrolase|nr:SAM-dependent chlorinase/fluorinase [Prevotellaceae bacterium]
MPIITLTTDWGSGDYYLGRLKGRILSSAPSVVFADITHHIQQFNTLQAAFILRNTYPCYPKGSIHIVGVNSEPSPSNPIVVIQTENYFFIGPNDGMFSIVLDNEPDEVVLLNSIEKRSGFRALEIIATAVGSICNHKSVDSIGIQTTLKKEHIGKAAYNEDSISGYVSYIDSFGNVITNITKELFFRVGQGRRFEILVQNNFSKITELSNHYDDVRPGRMLAIFNSFDLLELAMNQANISQLESLESKSSIRVKFYD